MKHHKIETAYTINSDGQLNEIALTTLPISLDDYGCDEEEVTDIQYPAVNWHFTIELSEEVSRKLWLWFSNPRRFQCVKKGNADDHR